jgi:hypothetical protein
MQAVEQRREQLPRGQGEGVSCVRFFRDPARITWAQQQSDGAFLMQSLISQREDPVRDSRDS